MNSQSLSGNEYLRTFSKALSREVGRESSLVWTLSLTISIIICSMSLSSLLFCNKLGHRFRMNAWNAGRSFINGNSNWEYKIPD